MIAKSLDVVVLLKLLALGQRHSYAELSGQLGISASEIHGAVRRSVAAGLIEPDTLRPLFRPLEEYLIHGVRYAFPAQRGPVSRGLPTAYAAPPLAAKIHLDDLPPVWADPDGRVKGYSVVPLYRSVPAAARRDSILYEFLALVDTLRVGRTRERKLAEEELRIRLSYAAAH